VLAGEADLESAGRLREMLVAQIWREPRRLTVDLAGVEFMDSDAVRVLAVAAKLMREHGGDLVLARPSPRAAKVLSLLGVDQMITVVEWPEA